MGDPMVKSSKISIFIKNAICDSMCCLLAFYSMYKLKWYLNVIDDLWESLHTLHIPEIKVLKWQLGMKPC
jgi:hypothetical protein